jgi:hypothetical protein
MEFYKVDDAGLKRYWPDGITRIVFEIKDMQLEGKNDLEITELK